MNSNPFFQWKLDHAQQVNRQLDHTKVIALATALNPSYQWYSNTSNSTIGGTLISGGTLASFTPPSAVGNIGTTYYYCMVTN